MKGTVKDLYSMYSKAGNDIGDSPQAAVVQSESNQEAKLEVPREAASKSNDNKRIQTTAKAVNLLGSPKGSSGGFAMDSTPKKVTGTSN